MSRLDKVALVVAREYLEDMEYSYVYEDERIPYEDWEEVYDIICDRVKVVLDD